MVQNIFMLAIVEIIEGDQSGEKHSLWQGARVGRTTGELILSDPKVSSLHAQIELNSKGGLVLVDQNSANGIKINGRRVKRVAMLPGVIFSVGKSTLRVIELKDEPPPSLTPSESSKNWKDSILNYFEGKELHFTKNSSKEPLAFRPALEFSFIEGPQFEQKILVGFGPRQFGSNVLDIELIEPMCPPIAFELSNENGVAIFKTQYPKLVRLNDSNTAESPLNEGDKIRIGQTLILVGFAS